MAKYYTLEEAASKLGISDDALKTLIDDGSLKTFMDQGMSKIRAQDVHSLAEQQGTGDSEEKTSDEEEVLILDDIAGDSDVEITFDEPEGGDSDVLLVDSGDEGADDNPFDSDLVLVTDEGEDGGDVLSDSGISLEQPADSGISLEQPAAGEEMSDDLLETDFEVPVLELEDATEVDLAVNSDFELESLDEAPADNETQVISLDEDEAVDPAAATALADHSEVMLDESDDVGMAAGLSEDSESDFAAPVASMRAQETGWSTIVLVGLTFTTVVTAFASVLMLELVRTLWSPHQPNQLTSPVIEMIANLF